jgi:hypothetical protein
VLACFVVGSYNLKSLFLGELMKPKVEVVGVNAKGKM